MSVAQWGQTMSMAVVPNSNTVNMRQGQTVFNPEVQRTPSGRPKGFSPPLGRGPGAARLSGGGY
ncbi:hypothetical protein THICB1_110465 [Thiomonas arsenitoxydans]|uniref:Uncharacterized protein n=1 Tax=Thiomonas arsenitoxydans (strain DSM 22701 / CIP 110005 / 3As) TaxID=426114 RepID=A0ABP1YZT7_THIA3|nr:hypothetical protein THICB1_110465 [Thiomonas arsenitoxydans]